MGNNFGSDPIIKPIRATNVDFLKFNNRKLAETSFDVIPYFCKKNFNFLA